MTIKRRKALDWVVILLYQGNSENTDTPSDWSDFELYKYLSEHGYAWNDHDWLQE